MKNKILEKAEDLFITLGFKSVTMDDLANALGVSKKTIYLYFPNKTKLVEEASLDLFSKINTSVDRIRAEAKNPIEELYEIKKFVMHYLKDEKSSPQHQLQKYYPKIFDCIRQKQFDMMETCTIDNVQRGIQQGIYRENLNVDFVSRIYFSGVISIKDPKLFPITKFPVLALQDDFLEYHLRGIVTPKGRKILNGIINSNHE